MGLGSWLRAFATAGRGVTRGIDQDALTEAVAGHDPIPLFERWFREATDAGIYLPESMTLATATPGAEPSARQVLLKGHSDEGFTFYTNYESRKAAELDANPRAALLFHWATLHRQVRVEGPVTRTTLEESEAYHASRPRGSRIAAWASTQSAEIESRALLEERFRQKESEFRDGDVPLPPFWGGYRVRPERIEFWQGRANRMHDRILFRRAAADERWDVVRLSP